MIICNKKEYEIITNILKVVASKTNLFWKSEEDIDHDKPEYKEYLKLKEELKFHMDLKRYEEIDLMKLLYNFR